MWRRLFPGTRTKHAAAHTTGALLATAVGVLVYQGYFAPLRRDMVEHSQHIDRVNLLVARGDLAARDHRAMRKRQAELTAASRRIRGKMPTKASAGEFVARSTELATQCGLEVVQCNSGPPQVHEGYATIDVNCTLAGSFASVGKYFDAVDQLPQISRVRRFDMSKSAEPEGYPVQVTFELYYQVDPHDKDQQRAAR